LKSIKINWNKHPTSRDKTKATVKGLILTFRREQRSSDKSGRRQSQQRTRCITFTLDSPSRRLGNPITAGPVTFQIATQKIGIEFRSDAVCFFHLYDRLLEATICNSCSGGWIWRDVWFGETISCVVIRH
jgi:hypothetical protein